MPRSSRSLRRSAARLASIAIACVGAGCGPDPRAIVSEVVYEPPMERSVVVETVVDLDFESTWNALIRRLSESPYRVAALEKASRFVRVDLVRSSDLAAAFNKPARFVDCGRTTRTFEPGDGADVQRFDYVVAESSRYIESDAVDGGFRVSEVERRVDLEASATIFLQPEGARRTRVTVKSRYQVEIEISGQATFHPIDTDEPAGEPRAFGPRTESIRFTTFQPGKDKRSGGLTCRATGDFEHALVALANPAAAI
ncbi:MAG: hypothetical protein NXI30_13740 [bacterium]|nr:hypothetical protein [bacterium]